MTKESSLTTGSLLPASVRDDVRDQSELRALILLDADVDHAQQTRKSLQPRDELEHRGKAAQNLDVERELGVEVLGDLRLARGAVERDLVFARELAENALE